MRYAKSLWSYNPFPKSCAFYAPLWHPGLRDAVFRSVDSYRSVCTVTQALLKADGRYFDGFDDVIKVTNPFQTLFQGSFTIIVWVKPDDGQPAALNVLLGYRNAGAEDGFHLAIQPAGDADAGKLYAWYAENRTTGGGFVEVMTNVAMFADGQETWHQCACIADSTIGGAGGLKLGFDGAIKTLDAVKAGNTTGITFANFATTRNMWIGARNTDGVWNLGLAGLIDEVIFIPKALTAAELAYGYRYTKRRLV